ncbi:hypothetical protein AEAC466_15635 [Asticcacaulis sp. AC466]|uniref:peptidylprolyl isomerase n=1 Tax=Asticcacaulis sp. AC466 TaxID=1282362 RepID=UPI0003C3F519|nr:peptidylprolyl isomerase [Asticcacaulis sp. AC466]ESQ82935.1 hypothetical protein AEAC466_15635 [Asticcacaulis sp. AC466]
MISLFREFTKSWIFKGLMVLLVASFAIFGLRDVFSKTGGDNVITAGKRQLSAQEFKSRFESYKANYPKENQGRTFTNEEFVEAGQHVRMLNELADQLSFAAWLDSLGVKPSAKMIVAEIAKIPAFFNSVTGRFDKDTYRQLLAQNQMNEKMFESSVSDELASQQYLTAAVAGVRAPRIYAATEAATTLQNRDTSLFVISSKNVPTPAAPTDAELQAFYSSRLSQLQLPETRTASIVQFVPANYAKDIKVDEAALQKKYKDSLATLVSPETRSFVTVTAQSAGDANAISSALKSGQTPEEAAKAHKGQVINYTLKPKSAVPDPKIAAAAFGMKTGDVSGAVQGELGYAVIKMGEVKIGSTPSYESVREKLAADYIKDQAADRVNKDSNAFSDAMRAGNDFHATAAKLGLKVTQLPPMTSEGKTGNPQADYSQYTVLVKDIYDLPQVGATSDVDQLGEGQYFAVRLDTIKPAGAPPFAEIKNELTQYWMTDKVTSAVQDAADKAMARIKKGESFAAVAASFNTPVEHLNGLNRATIQRANLPQALAGRIFLSQPGESFNAQISPVAFAIGRVDAVHQADTASANTMTTVARTQMSQMLARDLATTAQTGARALVKAKVYPRTAEIALGVTPTDDKAGKADKTDGKKTP